MDAEDEKSAISPEDLPVAEKLRIIDSSISLEQLKSINTGYLPPVPLVKPDSYYFISYSHRDYKRVYKDLFALQARGINLWYDRGMRAGSDWKEVADEFITPSKCAGVIFYISENSLASSAIHTEMEYAKKCGKSCLTINLPIESEFTFDGEYMRGKEISALKLLDVMAANGVCIPDEKRKYISETFYDSVIYVKYSSCAEEKTEKILGLKRPPLLEIKQDTYVIGKVKDRYIVSSVNDIDIRAIDRDAYDCCKDDNFCIEKVEKIDKCAFANCKKLKRVYLPESISEIGENSFYGCVSLTDVNLESIVNVCSYAFMNCISLRTAEFGVNDCLTAVGESAFEMCGELESLNLSKNLKSIGARAFCGCKRLKEVFFPVNGLLKSVGESAFMDCVDLKAVRFPDKVQGGSFDVLPSAFERCKSLKSIKLPCGAVNIFRNAFKDCDVLHTVYLPAGLTKIEDGAFRGCSNLSEIYFAGSKSEWNAVEKDFGWDFGNTRYTVHCNDGICTVNTNTKMDFGTERTRKLLDLLGSPDDKLKIVHIAGSIGKGSVAESITRILIAAGKKTGTFMSPYVYDYCEQFRIDGVPAEYGTVTDYIGDILEIKGDLHITQFEAETAAALKLFADSGCEYAVIECGLGGKLDATNAVNSKELAVITPICLEHTSVLGKTVKEISEQKAGIIKNCPAVVGWEKPRKEDFFSRFGANYISSEFAADLGDEGNEFYYKGERYSAARSIAKSGAAATAIEAAEILGIDRQAIREGLKNVKLPGRQEEITKNGTTYILDGAHVPESIMLLSYRLKSGFNCRKTIIFGCLSDKQPEKMLDMFENIAETVTIIAVDCNSPRSMSKDKILSFCKRRWFFKTDSAGSVSEALEKADTEVVAVCGSFTLLKEAKQWIEKK